MFYIEDFGGFLRKGTVFDHESCLWILFFYISGLPLTVFTFLSR